MSSSSDVATAFHPVRLGLAAEADAVRAEARASGYAAGWAEGRRAAAVQAEAELSSLRARELDAGERARTRAIAAVESAMARWEATLVPALDEAADLIVDAALELAEAVIGRELSAIARRDVARIALRRALTPLPVDGPVRVRLNPADLEALGETTSTDGHLLELVPDAGLASGDAIAERDGALVDARMSAALDRARAVVRR